MTLKRLLHLLADCGIAHGDIKAISGGDDDFTLTLEAGWQKALDFEEALHQRFQVKDARLETGMRLFIVRVTPLNQSPHLTATTARHTVPGPSDDGRKESR